MSSKSQILANVRLHQPAAGPLPEYPEGVRYDDPVYRFCETLKLVGGMAVPVKSPEDIPAHLGDHPPYASAAKIISLVEGVGEDTVSLDDIADPHELADVDFAIIGGEFGVAENGAIWFTDQGVRHRVLPFITQHLAIVLSATEIVHNMHQAYQRITIDGPQFGVFISGPSKTADIEQSLVIGAHGSRSLVVYLLDT
jgi:L-lactate dehydrogenase complex protein LldG